VTSELAPQPEPDLAGSFAIYNTPEGAVVMVVRLAGEPGERRGLVPAPIAAAARALLDGGEITPKDLWRALRSARAGGRDAIRP
jgi:hypothetical protein